MVLWDFCCTFAALKGVDVMAKVKTAYFCQNCGTQYSRWQGQCYACKEWNTIVEEVVQKELPKAWQDESSESTEVRASIADQYAGRGKAEQQQSRAKQRARRGHCAWVGNLARWRTRDWQEYPAAANSPEPTL